MSQRAMRDKANRFETCKPNLVLIKKGVGGLDTYRCTECGQLWGVNRSAPKRKRKWGPLHVPKKS